MLAYRYIYDEKYFNLAYNDEIPFNTNKVKHIKIVSIFNNNINIIFDKFRCLTHALLGKEFNDNINIPSTVTYIKFGFRYNQPTTIPNSVIYLKFGDCYNQPTIIPNSIIYLKFGHCYNQPTTQKII